jgi:hypothetical protein
MIYVEKNGPRAKVIAPVQVPLWFFELNSLDSALCGGGGTRCCGHTASCFPYKVQLLI